MSEAVGAYRTLAHKIIRLVDESFLPELERLYAELSERDQRELRTASQTPADIRRVMRPATQITPVPGGGVLAEGPQGPQGPRGTPRQPR